MVIWKLKFLIKHMPAKHVKHTRSNRSTGQSHSACWRWVQIGSLVLWLWTSCTQTFRINQWEKFQILQNEAHNSLSLHFRVLNLPCCEAMLHSFSNGSSLFSEKNYHFNINTEIHLTLDIKESDQHFKIVFQDNCNSLAHWNSKVWGEKAVVCPTFAQCFGSNCTLYMKLLCKSANIL